jgi:hypothetical protein
MISTDMHSDIEACAEPKLDPDCVAKERVGETMPLVSEPRTASRVNDFASQVAWVVKRGGSGVHIRALWQARRSYGTPPLFDRIGCRCRRPPCWPSCWRSPRLSAVSRIEITHTRSSASRPTSLGWPRSQALGPHLIAFSQADTPHSIVARQGPADWGRRQYGGHRLQEDSSRMLLTHASSRPRRPPCESRRALHAGVRASRRGCS